MPVESEAVSERGRRRLSTAVLVAVALAVFAVIALVVGLGALLLRPDQEHNGEVSMSHPMPDLSRGDRGEVRHDLEPLVKRFGALGSPRGATWQGGTLGSDRAPGPSTYWIEAVVQLEPGSARQLAEAHDAKPVAAPVIDEALSPALTAGPWLASDGLDGDFRAEGFSGRAYLNAEHDTLVLLVVGGPN